jgi:predicted dehydrogenase
LSVPKGERKIRVGVVGLGYFGSFHVRQYAANPSAELVAVVDADAPRAVATGIANGAEGLTDHRALIGKVDAVSVTAPTSLHHAIARDLIDAGIHVFVEKPVAANVVDAADLAARADKARVTLQVGHIERFSPSYQALASRARALRSIACIRHAPWKGRAVDVDVVLDLMIHDIDLALALARAPVISVSAAGTPVVSNENDVVGARLTFDNGVVANLSASRVAGENERSVTVNEAGRKLRADLSAHTLTITPEGGTPETQAFERPDNLAAEIASFLDCVATGARPLVDGKAGLEALKVAEMIRTAVMAEQTRTGVMDG